MAGKEKLKLDLLVFAVLVIYPLYILGLGIWYGMTYGIGKFEIILFFITHYLANISIGVGLHRCWSHGAYKLHKIVEFPLALLSAGTLQGPALVWCSDHYKHHTFTDKEGDPHSPLKYKNPVKGFMWAHIGWMLFGNGHKQIDKITLAKLGRNKILRWQMKYYWQIAVAMNVVFPLIIGYFAGGMTIKGALAGFIFMGLGRAFQQHITFCINSIMHYVGSTPYAVSTARDSWWLFPFVLGENWHNFHHAFPMDYRNGVKWYQPDIHKWIIWTLEKMGLATAVIRTSDVRIKAKLEETARQKQELYHDKLSFVEEAAAYFAKAASEKLSIAEKSAEALKAGVRKKLEVLQARAQNLADSARASLASTEDLQKTLVNKYNKQLENLQMLATEYNISFQGAKA